VRQQIADVLARMAEHEAGFSSQFAVPAEVGKYLQRLVLEHKLTRIVELGTWRGASAIYLGSALEELGQGQVTTVNLPHEEANIQQARDNIAASGLSNYVTQVLQSAEDYLQQAKEQGVQFDLIFIDADKGRVDSYVRLGLDVLSPSGYIVVDDWKLLNNQQQAFFQRLQQENNLNLRVVDIGNGLAVLTRK
jgi:caffeoyl-CoA O-methyltransferase